MDQLLMRGDRLLLALEVFSALSPDACAAYHSEDLAERARYDREYNPRGFDRDRLVELVNRVLKPERRFLAQLAENWVPSVVRPVLSLLRGQPYALLERNWNAEPLLDGYEPIPSPPGKLTRAEVRALFEQFAFGAITEAALMFSVGVRP